MKKSEFQEKYGPCAVITGASDGIGQEFARVVAKNGLNTILIARREERLKLLSEELTKAYGTEHRILVADLSKAESITVITQSTKDLCVGLLIAAAGYGTSGMFVENKINDEIEMIDVNCRSVVALAHYFGNQFKHQKHGGIILMSSLVGFQGVPRAANYAATKAFIQTLAEGLRVEMKPFHVDVLSVAPGPVNSGFGKRANMNLGAAATPKTVASVSINALSHRTTVRPGFLAKFLEFLLKPMPRFGRVLIMGIVMKGMTKHQG